MTISGTTIILTIVAVIIGYSIYLFYPIYHATKISDALIAQAVPYQQHPSNSSGQALIPNKYFLVAGDSTAVGVGTSSNIYSTAGRLGQEFPDADITNVAVSGARLADLIKVLQKQQQEHKHYDLLLVQIGANDVTHLTSYPKTSDEVAIVYNLASQLSSKTIVMTAGDIGLSDVFHWPLSSIMMARSLRFRTIFMNAIAQYPTVSYIDLYKSKQDDPFGKDVPKYYAPDHFHLTDAGYGLWYADIQKYL
jgi:lysophospholipase L1-like esterase